MPDERKSATQRAVQARIGRDLAEVLRELYVEKRWTDQEISVELDVARSTVRTWRGEFGIDRSARRAALTPATQEAP